MSTCFMLPSAGNMDKDNKATGADREQWQLDDDVAILASGHSALALSTQQDSLQADPLGVMGVKGTRGWPVAELVRESRQEGYSI